jgi:hypothetical protein
MQAFIALPDSDRIANAPSHRAEPFVPLSAGYERFTDGAESRRVAALELAYGQHGGMASAEDVVNMLSHRNHAQPLSRVARWLVDRDVVSFDWQGTTWLPLFQFEQGAMTLRLEVTAVIRELSGVFDGWELAGWFVSPNTGLGNMTPVAVISALPAAVCEAARVDRFIARG